MIATRLTIETTRLLITGETLKLANHRTTCGDTSCGFVFEIIVRMFSGAHHGLAAFP
jgi:hypothetical protein